MIRWFRRALEVPTRQQIVAAIEQLPALPEADRMRHRPMERAKPKTVAAWRALHDWRNRA